MGLERAIVQAAGRQWANQIPTSSGLVGPHADKARKYARREAATADSVPIVRGGWVATAVLMLSNSGDTLAIFLPLLAESSARVIWWEIGFYLLVALAWGMLALLVSSNLGATRRVVQLGNRLVPWVMIGAGAYILLDTATDSLL